MHENRREFVRLLGAAGACGLTVVASNPVRAEPPLETKRIRLIKFPSICQAPVFVAEELLRAEGFTDISYVDAAVLGARPQTVQLLTEGKVDTGVHFAAPLAIAIDRGAEISVLGGVHTACYELFTVPSVRSIKDARVEGMK